VAAEGLQPQDLIRDMRAASDKTQISSEASEHQTESASIVVPAALLTFSLGALVTAAALPSPQDWTTAPALLPLGIAALLLAITLALVMQALRDRRRPRDHSAKHPTLPAASDIAYLKHRGALAAALFVLLGIYISALLPLWPFEAATIVFLLAVGLLAERRLPPIGRLVLTVVFPPAFVLVFTLAFGLPAPGNGSLVMQLCEWLGFI